MNDKQEYIICAAIWYQDQPTSKIQYKNIDRGAVVCGLRHGHCIGVFVTLSELRSVTVESGKYVKGFITSKDRFVDRKEAATIAFKAGQTEKDYGTLISEHLY